MKRVVIGLIGQVLDAPKGDVAERWERWRPTVSIGQQEDLLVDRFELLHTDATSKTARLTAADLAAVSPESAVNLHRVEARDEWDFEEVFGMLHDFAGTYPFDLENEEYFVHITTGTHVVQICLFLLTESGHFPAKLLQTSPPKKRQTRDPGRYVFIDLDLSRYDALAARFHAEKAAGSSFLKSGIDTRNAAFNTLIEEIEQVAVRSRDPMLLMGPTGAGKSQLAQRIYALKKQRGELAGGFVPINCATIRGQGAASALFGHVKGAFTGADRDRPGLLRAAHKGLLFLDEIGELGLEEQAMLLRAIEEKHFLPVGADVEVGSDFQLICGTNRDLPAESAAGRFRADLLARINLWSYRLPGLAERREDLAPNLDYELDQYAARHGRRIQFNKEARQRFLQFAESADTPWRANFRDLNAAVTRMATLASGNRIDADAVNREISRLRAGWQTANPDPDQQRLLEHLGPDTLATIDRFDQVQLADVIRVCQQSSSISQAGRTLFAVSRKQKSTPNDADRLRKYLAKFHLTLSDLKD